MAGVKQLKWEASRAREGNFSNRRSKLRHQKHISGHRQQRGRTVKRLERNKPPAAAAAGAAKLNHKQRGKRHSKRPH